MNPKSFFPFLLILLLSFNTIAQDSLFHDFELKEFSFQGHEAKIVFPRNPNEARNWIWRARFWGHEPQLDIALLEKGFHVVYVDVADLFGNQVAVQRWNDFYEFCRKEYNLNSKVVLEGLSRGGLIIYNWASQNTDKVFSIYADAPVCDIKSWPGGLFAGQGSPSDWENCLDAYGLDSISVRDFKGIPIYTSKAIAEAKIPVIHVYGESDKVVPFMENTYLLAEEFKKSGGEITLIPKPGIGHHPHSLKDPSVLVKFILKSVEK